MGYLLLYLPAIFVLVLFVGAAAFIIWFCKSFYEERGEKQKKAEA